MSNLFAMHFYFDIYQNCVKFLPDDGALVSKVCQSNSKAFVTYALHFTLCQECVKSIMSNSYQIHITHIYFKYYLKIVSKLCQIFSPVSKLCQIYSTKILLWYIKFVSNLLTRQQTSCVSKVCQIISHSFILTLSSMSWYIKIVSNFLAKMMTASLCQKYVRSILKHL